MPCISRWFVLLDLQEAIIAEKRRKELNNTLESVPSCYIILLGLFEILKEVAQSVEIITDMSPLFVDKHKIRSERSAIFLDK